MARPSAAAALSSQPVLHRLIVESPSSASKGAVVPFRYHAVSSAIGITIVTGGTELPP